MKAHAGVSTSGHTHGGTPAAAASAKVTVPARLPAMSQPYAGRRGCSSIVRASFWPRPTNTVAPLTKAAAMAGRMGMLIARFSLLKYWSQKWTTFASS
jgi:hypothetical protein